MVCRPTLALLPVWRWTVSRSLLSACLNPTAEDLGRLRPVAVLVLMSGIPTIVPYSVCH
jgi:hypothetical protein